MSEQSDKLERAAELLRRYAATVRDCHADELERFDYLPEIEDCAEAVAQAARYIPSAVAEPDWIPALTFLHRHRRHVELSPGAGKDAQAYALAVLDDLENDLRTLLPKAAEAAPRSHVAEHKEQNKAAPYSAEEIEACKRAGWFATHGFRYSDVTCAFFDGLRSTRSAIERSEPVWVVNNMGELGVKVGERFFFLYKGDNIEYEIGLHDDGTPIMWRIVGKREFGETCQPMDRFRDKWPGGQGALYMEPLVFTPGLSDGLPEDGEWRPLPVRSPESRKDRNG